MLQIKTISALANVGVSSAPRTILTLKNDLQQYHAQMIELSYKKRKEMLELKTIIESALLPIRIYDVSGSYFAFQPFQLDARKWTPLR